jgi:hypothetical protein
METLPKGLQRKYAALAELAYEGSEQQELDRIVDFAISVGIDPWKGFQTASTTSPGPVRSNKDRTFDVRYWSDRHSLYVCRNITGVNNGKQLAEEMARKLNRVLRNRLNCLVISGTARPKHMNGVHVQDLLKERKPCQPS